MKALRLLKVQPWKVHVWKGQPWKGALVGDLTQLAAERLWWQHATVFGMKEEHGQAPQVRSLTAGGGLGLWHEPIV